MRLCALLSGGKDSNYALYKALIEGHDVECVIVVKPRKDDSWLFHSVYPEIAILQAKSIGIRNNIYLFNVSGDKDLEILEFEHQLSMLKRVIDFDGLICGAISSRYQLTRFENIARKFNLKLYTPLWGVDQSSYMRKLVTEGFIFIITKISTMGLPKSFLAKPITVEHVEEIIRLSHKYGFNPAFEGGEAETLVIDAPHYLSKICIEGDTRSVSEFEHIVRISRYWLGEKNTDCLFVKQSF